MASSLHDNITQIQNQEKSNNNKNKHRARLKEAVESDLTNKNVPLF